MAIRGRRPKPDGEALNASPKVHTWTIVEDVPYSGSAPSLPRDLRWSPASKRRWAVIRALPHAALWGPAEWELAIDYLRLFEAKHGEPNSELRIRGNELGLSASARAALRIRYVEAGSLAEAGSSPTPASVANIDDYRDL